MTRRSIKEIIARADELADRFNYEPHPGDENAPLPPVMALKLAAWRRDAAERDLAAAIREARGCPGGTSARRSAPAARPPAKRSSATA